MNPLPRSTGLETSDQTGQDIDFDRTSYLFFVIENIRTFYKAHLAVLAVSTVSVWLWARPFTVTADEIGDITKVAAWLTFARELISSGWTPAFFVVPLLYCGVVMLWVLAAKNALSFTLYGDRVHIVEGVLFRFEKVIYFANVQGMSLRSDLLGQLLKRSVLEGHTAGGLSGHAEIVAPGITLEEALRYRGVLQEHADTITNSNPYFKLPTLDIIIGALTQSSVTIALLAIIVPVLSRIWTTVSTLDLTPDALSGPAVFGWLMGILGTILLMLISVVGLAWRFIANLARQLFQLYKFSVLRFDETLFTTRGLLTRYETFMSTVRIQAVVIRQPFLQRVIRFASVDLDTAGFRNVNKKGASITSIAPALWKSKVSDLIAEMLPAYDVAPKTTRSDLRGLGRYTFGPSMLAGSLVAGIILVPRFWATVAATLNNYFAWTLPTHVASWVVPVAWIAVGASLVLLATQIDSWFAMQAGFEGDTLVLRSGCLSRQEVRINRRDLQGITFRQTIFQVNDGHVHLHAFVLNGAREVKYTVRNLNTAVAASIRDWYSN